MKLSSKILYIWVLLILIFTGLYFFVIGAVSILAEEIFIAIFFLGLSCFMWALSFDVWRKFSEAKDLGYPSMKKFHVDFNIARKAGFKNVTEWRKKIKAENLKKKKLAAKKAKEKAERKAKREAEEEAKRKAREEAEKKAREESERKAIEEAERKAREEAERLEYLTKNYDAAILDAYRSKRVTLGMPKTIVEEIKGEGHDLKRNVSKDGETIKVKYGKHFKTLSNGEKSSTASFEMAIEYEKNKDNNSWLVTAYKDL